MFDVFTEEIEVLIKTGISNLYWYRGDLQKAWIRSGVQLSKCKKLFAKKHIDGRDLFKRELMDALYIELRDEPYNRRVEISRNFVRILVEHKNFVPTNEKHRIEVAEQCALKLRAILLEQQKEQEKRELLRANTDKIQKESYEYKLTELKERFEKISILDPQKRGYELEKLFTNLMKISNIQVHEPFKIVGEQIDGAIKFDGHFYLLEIKWIEKKVSSREVASLYYKVEGKFESRGLFISMNGYSSELLSSLPKGKEFKALLLDGLHVTNVIYGIYSFKELLDYAISEASLRGEIYCSHAL